MPKRNCFISYHHNSDYKYLKDLRMIIGGRLFKDYGFNDENLSEASKRFISKKIQHRIWSSSITIVLVGEKTGSSDWVDWEIWYSLRTIVAKKISRRRFKPKGLVAIFLPVENHNIPRRLQENLESGYAIKIQWNDIEGSFYKVIDQAYVNRQNIKKIKNDESSLRIRPQENINIKFLNKILDFINRLNFI